MTSLLPSASDAPVPRDAAIFTPAPSQALAIELRGLTRVFGMQPALVQVDLAVRRGEVVLVRGPNGAGKSTLLGLLATTISPTFGVGLVHGHDISRERTQIRAITELLGHRNRLYGDLTPAEYLRFIARMYGLGAADIEGAITTMGLERVARRPCRELSQGTQQRVALARAVLRRPQVLLLDEPYASLDQGARSRVDGLVAGARTWGATVLLATHDVSRAESIVDRSIRLASARIVPEASVAAPVHRIAGAVS